MRSLALALVEIVREQFEERFPGLPLNGGKTATAASIDTHTAVRPDTVTMTGGTGDEPLTV